jgi:hypothetical protein
MVCGLWRRVDLLVDTNVSEKHTASIFSPEDGGSIFLQNEDVCLQVHAIYNPDHHFLLNLHKFNPFHALSYSKLITN